MHQKPIFFGEEVKALDDTGRIGGWVVRYGNHMLPDASKMRDFFNEQTDFDMDDGDKKSVLHEHGLSPLYGGASIGRLVVYKRTEGVWGEGELRSDLNGRDKLLADIKAGKYGYSSGSQSYRVEREPQPNGTHYIKRWPIGEVSLTTNPAEPRAHAYCIKSLNVPDPGDPMPEIKTSVGLSVSDYNYENSTSMSMSASTYADNAEEMYERLSEVQNTLALFLNALREGTTEAKSAAMESYLKIGAKVSGTNGKKLTSMHDLLCEIYPSACPAHRKDTSTKSVVDAALLTQLADAQLIIRARDTEITSLKAGTVLTTAEGESTESLKAVIEAKVAEIEALKTELESTKANLVRQEAVIKEGLTTNIRPLALVAGKRQRG